MSTDLYWRPRATTAHRVGDTALKRILARRWDDVHRTEVTLDIGAIQYLQGLVDAQIPGASDIIAAIEKHEVIELWLQ